MRIPTSVALCLLLAFAATPEPSSGTQAPAAPAASAPPPLDWRVVSRRPHDPGAFTQGLQLDAEGRLFESTGLYGRSTLREVDPLSGAVLRAVALPDSQFGEGLALVGDRLIQITWREGIANAWDAESFELVDTFEYDGEGWGLCHDGERLIMSDGSDRLTFRDPETFQVEGSVRVVHADLGELRLNELECVDGLVWANLWLTDTIVRIDPGSGALTGRLELGELRREVLADPTNAAAAEAPDVLNGIAWDEEAGTFLLTGKLWPTLFEIGLLEPA